MPTASATCSAAEAEAYLVWNGTGANVMALATLRSPRRLRGVQRVGAHRGRRDRCAERILGAKLDRSPGAGRQARSRISSLALAHLEATCTTPSRASCRSPRAPSSARCTPPTRSPRCATTAHRLGMLVHMDGARIANATAALGGTLDGCGRSPSTPGSTCSPSAAPRPACRAAKPSSSSTPVSPLAPCSSASRSTSCRRRCASSPPSSTRCSTTTCGSASPSTPTRCAARLYELTRRSTRRAARAPAVNSLFPSARRHAIEPLQQWCFFWDWDVHARTVRWMTSWDTDRRRQLATVRRHCP